MQLVEWTNRWSELGYSVPTPHSQARFDWYVGFPMNGLIMATMPVIFGNEEKSEVNEITKKHKQKKTKKGEKTVQQRIERE